MTYLDELKNIRLANHFHVGPERLCRSRSDAGFFFFSRFLAVDLNMVFLSEHSPSPLMVSLMTLNPIPVLTSNVWMWRAR